MGEVSLFQNAEMLSENNSHRSLANLFIVLEKTSNANKIKTNFCVYLERNLSTIGNEPF